MTVGQNKKAWREQQTGRKAQQKELEQRNEQTENESKNEQKEDRSEKSKKQVKPETMQVKHSKANQVIKGININEVLLEDEDICDEELMKGSQKRKSTDGAQSCAKVIEMNKRQQ